VAHIFGENQPTMKTQYFISLGILFFVQLQLSAQLEVVTKLLPDDTAAVVFADNIPALADRIRDFPLFADEYFEKAVETACNEENPLIQKEKWNTFLDKLEALVSDPERVEQLYLAIHSLDPNDIRYTVMLKSRLAQNENMAVAVSNFVEFLKHIDQKESATESSENLDPGKLRALEFFGSYQASYGDWSIVGNDQRQIENIGKRIKGETTGRTLDEARVFHATRNRLTSKWSKPGVVHVFVRPEALRPYFPEIDDQTWKAMRISELPGAAVQISLNDSNPYIVANTIVQFTSPATGIAKQWQAYREIETWPRLPFEIVGLNAMAFDREEVEAAKAEMNDQKNGEGDYLRTKKETYLKYDIDYEKDFIKRSNTYFAAYFYHEANNRQFALFEQVRDRDAMLKYVKGMVKLDNNDKKEYPVQEIEIENQMDYRVWGMTNEGLYKFYKEGNVNSEKRPDEITYKTFPVYGFALSDVWYIHSSLSHFEEIFAALENMHEINGFETVKKQVAEIEKGLGFAKRACHVKVDSIATYQFMPSQYMKKHYQAKFNVEDYNGQPDYKVPPEAYGNAIRALSKGDVAPDLEDSKEVIATTQYYLLKSLLNSLDRQYMVYGMDGSTLQVGVTLSGKPTKSEKP
jgi:hypothetical protein